MLRSSIQQNNVIVPAGLGCLHRYLGLRPALSFGGLVHQLCLTVADIGSRLREALLWSSLLLCSEDPNLLGIYSSGRCKYYKYVRIRFWERLEGQGLPAKERGGLT